ncbi:MAG: plasmid mobilization protein [Acidobacteriota bacterium]
MPVYRPRTRLVNFRLSEEEYQQLKETCARSGARSVSDYARSSVLSGAAQAGALAASFPSERIDQIESLLRRIDSRLENLIHRGATFSHG